MQLKLTDPIHTTTHRVLYGDTDAAGVVYYANYLQYFEIGRTELMRDWVCSYKEIEEMGIVLPVTECYTRFKSPARYDDLITIDTCIDTVSRLTCRFHYRISRQDPNQERPTLLVKGFTVNASIDMMGKLTPLPADITANLKGLSKKETEVLIVPK